MVFVLIVLPHIVLSFLTFDNLVSRGLSLRDLSERAAAVLGDAF